MQFHSKFQPTREGGDGIWNWQGDSKMYTDIQRVKNSKTAKSSLKNNSAGYQLPNQD